VQTLPSSITGGVPGWHVPDALQVSIPLQTLLSVEQSVPAGRGVWLTPVAGSQLSTVHALPSSMTGGVAGWHEPLELHVAGAHASLEHEVPGATGVCVTPSSGSHWSAVHGLPSSIATRTPATHVPALHVSPTVHALTEQAVPVGTGVVVQPDAVH
jgi:hypothetical protein